MYIYLVSPYLLKFTLTSPFLIEDDSFFNKLDLSLSKLSKKYKNISNEYVLKEVPTQFKSFVSLNTNQDITLLRYFSLKSDNAILHIYSFGIAILETTYKINQIDNQNIESVQHITNEYVNSKFQIFKDYLKEFEKIFFKKIPDIYINKQYFPSESFLWVNRTIVIEEIKEKDTFEFSKWLLVDNEKEIKNVNNIYIGWGHNIVCKKSLYFNDFKNSLRIMQYYSALMDISNRTFSFYISKFNENNLHQDIKKLSKELDEFTKSFGYMKMLITDVIYEKQGKQKIFISIFYNKYGLEDIHNNINLKIGLSKDISKQIFNKKSEKANKIIEILLFCLSGISILDFFTALPGYINSPYLKKNNVNDEIFGPTDFNAFLSPDLMFNIGSLVLIISLIIFIKNKK